MTEISSMSFTQAWSWVWH